MEQIKIKECKKVITADAAKRPNGWLLEVISDTDKFTSHLQGQVYLTVALPGTLKGYHLHAAADYFVTCLKGKIKEIIYTSRTDRKEIEMGDENLKTVFLPRGCPHAIENIGDEPAYVLIYRYPSWSQEFKEQFDIAPEDIETEQAWLGIKKFMDGFRSVNDMIK